MAINPIVQGDTRVWDLVITDRNGGFIDITNDLVQFTMKTKVGQGGDIDGTNLPTVLGPIAAVITDGPAGKCTITLTSDNTTGTGGLDVQNYFYDFQWNDTSTPPVVTTLEKGNVAVTDQVTDGTA